VAVALGGCSGLDSVAHHHIDFNLFSFFGGKTKKLSICLQEIDIFLLLGLAP
jgi:hypothetical protein